MTTAERNSLVLTLLEEVTPLIRKYTSAYRLDFEEMYQDASIAIMRLLDAGIDEIYIAAILQDKPCRSVQCGL